MSAKPELKNDITMILRRAHHGEASAGEELLRLVYQELRDIAGGKMAKEICRILSVAQLRM